MDCKENAPSAVLYELVRPLHEGLARLFPIGIAIAAGMAIWGWCTSDQVQWPSPSLSAGQPGFILNVWRGFVLATLLTACSVSPGIGFGAAAISLGVALAVWFSSGQIFVGCEYFAVAFVIFIAEGFFSDFTPQALRGVLQTLFIPIDWIFSILCNRRHPTKPCVGSVETPVSAPRSPSGGAHRSSYLPMPDYVLDDVAEWVARQYRVSFHEEPPDRKQEWIERFLTAHFVD